MTDEELGDVEDQIKELEQAQEALMAENRRLREQLDKKPPLVHIQSYTATLRKLRTELSQLNAVAKALKANQPLTLNLLMGGKVEEDRSESDLGVEVERLKAEVLALRNCVSDIYAEQCGSLCLTQ